MAAINYEGSLPCVIENSGIIIQRVPLHYMVPKKAEVVFVMFIGLALKEKQIT
jgi:hypothetical protein